MKVALIGISGRVGSRLADELLRRGHQVTGIARNLDNVSTRSGLTLSAGDATDASKLAPLLAQQDAVISASRFQSSDPKALVSAIKNAGVQRLLVVGGAGSLHTENGTALTDTIGFPLGFKAEAVAGSKFLDYLRSQKSLDWTFLSPSADFAPGARTGKFRLGNNVLIVDVNGKSSISMEDFAIAMVDELEAPKHSRQRFTVGY